MHDALPPLKRALHHAHRETSKKMFGMDSGSFITAATGAHPMKPVE